MVPQSGKNEPARAKAKQYPAEVKGLRAGSRAAAPLEEGIQKPRTRRYSTGNYGQLRYNARNIKTDFAVANALQRVGRKISEDYQGIGEYLASLGDEFERMERCTVYLALQQKLRDVTPKNLERRIEISRDGDEWCVDETAGHIILPSDEIFQIFADKTPAVMDSFSRLQLRFGNMNIDDDRCDVKEMASPLDSSVAMMPFYYRDRKHASGIVVFEGDLRCRDTEVTGLSMAYWTARLAMEMAAQLSFQLTHRFDAITALTKVPDFRIEFREAIRRLPVETNGTFLLLVDLDRFKSINELHGYRGGDATLGGVATAILNSVRAEDTVARLGGDEFSVVLKDVSREEAEAIAERIRRNIANILIFHNGKKIKVTCSIGMQDVKKLALGMGLEDIGGRLLNDSEVDQVFRHAFEGTNERLSQAKRGGRAQVVSG